MRNGYILLTAAVLLLVGATGASGEGIVLERSLTNADLDFNDDELNPTMRRNLDNSGGLDVVRCDSCTAGPIEVVDLGTGATIWSIDPDTVPGLNSGEMHLWGFANLDGDPAREAVFESRGPYACFPGPCPAPTFEILVVDPVTGIEELRLGSPGVAYHFLFLWDVDGDAEEELVVQAIDLSSMQASVEIYGRGPASVGVSARGAVGPVFSLIGVQPSPSTGALNVAFSVARMEPAVFEVFDISGRLRISHRLESASPGKHLLLLPGGGGLESGSYFLRLSQGSQRTSTKIVLRR